MGAQQVYIPDANFKAKLIALGIDTNANGEIDYSEAEVVSSLNLANSNISDLSGIEYFFNLTSIDFSNNNISSAGFNFEFIAEIIANDNPLTFLGIGDVAPLIQLSISNTLLDALDVAGRTSLIGITAGNVPLQWINVNGCTSLQFIQISNTPIVGIDLSTCSSLNNAYLVGNQLDGLLLPEDSVLQILNVSSNEILSLDVTGQPQLQLLDCQLNNMTSLDLSNSVGLTWLSAGGNNFTTIDVSNSPLLNNLQLAQNPELVSVFMKNGAIESTYSFLDCPNLAYICVDEEQIPAITAAVDPSVVVNSYCSFTPGGEYNTIAGTVRFDADGNGCDASDLNNEFIKIGISGSAGSDAAFTTSDGQYNFSVPSGSFNVFPLLENPSYFNVSPASASIIFSSVDNSEFSQDFCITPNGSHNDVEITVVPIFPSQPGFNSVYEIVYRNIGTQPASGNVTFSYPDAVLDLITSSVPPDGANSGTLTWNYNTLQPFENRSISVLFHVNSPTDTPPVALGDVFDFNATIGNSSGTDESPSNNAFLYEETVTGAYDPNDKICIEGEVVGTAQIGEYLHYVINFENTGTAPAQNIVVKDVINDAQFEMATLQVINSSHPVVVRTNANVAEFIFPNIALDPGGHGNILMKIKTKSSLSAGDTVSNKAEIFFDYNAPIETNFANTQFQSLGVADFTNTSIAIYPNPSNSQINIRSEQELASVLLFDVQGRLLQAVKPNAMSVVLDVTGKSAGMYFVRITTSDGTITRKIIKE